jgi:opacity protein-like surface antigen
MKVTILAPVALAAACLAGAASAQSWYGQVNLGTTLNAQSEVDASLTDGVVTVSDSAEFDLDNGLLATVAIGRDAGRVRVEGEVLYTKGDLSDSTLSDGTTTYDLGEVSVSQAAVMLNVLFDLGSSDRFAPYVGAGVGYGATRLEAPDIDEDDAATGVTWQVKAGVAIRASDRVTWDIGYRYLKAAEYDGSYSEPGFSYDVSVETESHALTVGLRVAF